MRPGFTVNLMVRDEEWTVWEALMSAAPFAGAVIVCDTGSTDGTLGLVEDALSRLPSGIDRVFLRREYPSLVRWGDHGERLHPSRDLGDVRNLMRDHSPTEWIWTVDADEVYTEAAVPALRSYAASLPAEVDCVYVPMTWLSDHPDYACARSDPGFYGITGRLFRNRPGYCHRTGRDSDPRPTRSWVAQQEGSCFPGECARYLLPDGRSCVPTPNHPNCRVVPAGMMEPVLHYEMVTKPWRRKSLGRAQQVPHPSVFEHRREIFGENLFTRKGAA